MIYLIPHILDSGAERYPEHEAMRFLGQALTYSQWAGRANALARLLVDQGVQRGDRVGIFLNKSLESAVALYGIMKAGAAYVPLDPSAPAARLAFVLRDCGIRILDLAASQAGSAAGTIRNGYRAGMYHRRAAGRGFKPAHLYLG
jgi:acyl-CoA synthetase (AMP-forming)/AMP-acid ligase II